MQWIKPALNVVVSFNISIHQVVWLSACAQQKLNWVGSVSNNNFYISGNCGIRHPNVRWKNMFESHAEVITGHNWHVRLYHSVSALTTVNVHTKNSTRLTSLTIVSNLKTRKSAIAKRTRCNTSNCNFLFRLHSFYGFVLTQLSPKIKSESENRIDAKG